MDEKNGKGNTLKAWTQEGDFVPTLYIQGEISTNGEKPKVELKDKDPQGMNPKDLLLEFVPDVYAPDGKSKLAISNYEKKLKTDDEYSTISIETKKGKINLHIERRPRKK